MFDFDYELGSIWGHSSYLFLKPEGAGSKVRRTEQQGL